VSGRARACLWASLAVITCVIVVASRRFLFDTDTALAALGGSIVLFGAVGWLCLSTYRSGRDLSFLLVGVGGIVVSVQYLLFWHVWSLVSFHNSLHADLFAPNTAFLSRLAAVPQFAIAWAWLTFAVCLLLVRPWWDRRGRSPIRPVTVLGSALVATGLFDLFLMLAPPTPHQAFIGLVGLGFGQVEIETGTQLMILGTVVVLVAATWRAVTGNEEGQLASRVPGTAVASIFAATTPLWAPRFLESTVWLLRAAAASWTLPLVAAAFAFGAVVSTMRTESGRSRRATDRADAVLGGRAEIASVIAHDVRSPVSSIKSIAASTIANYDRLDDAQRLEFVGMIDREARQVLDVVHQMSVALKVDAGSLELVRRPTALTDVIRHAVDEAETGDRSVEVADAPGLTATVDARWLAEAIRQGIDNAVAFSPEGTPVRIAVQVADGALIEITIEDEGPGIPPERREGLFERFARWRPAGYEEIPGSGLGLFICRGIVREHGGDATIENGAGRGTILRISLPWSTE
jgi:signal transduction histidine kinase